MTYDELPIPIQEFCNARYLEHDRLYTCVLMHLIGTLEPCVHRCDDSNTHGDHRSARISLSSSTLTMSTCIA
jgi:hypothetical protein